MDTLLCIGIASTREVLEIAVIEAGRDALVMRFPASGVGVEGIRVFLSGCDSRVRLAVAGVAALNLGLKLGNAPDRETFIVAAGIADRALALARYADHAA